MKSLTLIKLQCRSNWHCLKNENKKDNSGGVWKTSAEIPYWWRSEQHFWRAEGKFPDCTTNKRHYPDLGSDASIISMELISEFLHSFLRCHFLGKPVMSNPPPPQPLALPLQNVDCFLRPSKTLQIYILTWWWNFFVTDVNMYKGSYKWLVLYSVDLQAVQQR